MTTIAREYMDAKTELNRKYGIHPFMVPTPADWRTELDELMHSFYKKSIRTKATTTLPSTGTRWKRHLDW